MKNRLFATVATLAVCCLMIGMTTGCASLHLTQNFPTQGFSELALTPAPVPFATPQHDDSIQVLNGARVIDTVYRGDIKRDCDAQTVLASCTANSCRQRSRTVTRGVYNQAYNQALMQAQAQGPGYHRVRVRVHCQSSGCRSY